ncbi:hypothetical protein [Synechococcus sp. PCC 7336]|uniref:hypothetical protein n=1 Tax=Synechococcus sp. PCC 7336 TaxID=195250 RepID=UPI0005702E16|nr:hypothetical protein [Synechococcus sp. PCC 7336]
MRIITTLARGCALSAIVAVALPLAAEAQYENFYLSPGFTPDPAVGTGMSGGTVNTGDCGYIDTTPDHVLTVTKPFQYLKAYVDAPGDVTLLVTGPDGRFCRDDEVGLLPQLWGTWPAGTYQIWIGDFVGSGSGTYPYSLYLTEIE